MRYLTGKNFVGKMFRHEKILSLAFKLSLYMITILQPLSSLCTFAFEGPTKINLSSFIFMVKLLSTKVTVKISSLAENLSNFANEIFTDKVSWKILWVKVSKFINIKYSKHGTFSLTDFTLFSYVSNWVLFLKYYFARMNRYTYKLFANQTILPS